METFIIKGCKLISPEYAFCPLDHVPNCFAVILVGYLIVDGDVILCVNCGLYIVSYFSDFVSEHYLPALRIRNGDLCFSGFFELLFQISVIVFSLLLLVNLILYLLPVISVVFIQCPGIFL